MMTLWLWLTVSTHSKHHRLQCRLRCGIQSAMYISTDLSSHIHRWLGCHCASQEHLFLLNLFFWCMLVFRSHFTNAEQACCTFLRISLTHPRKSLMLTNHTSRRLPGHKPHVWSLNLIRIMPENRQLAFRSILIFSLTTVRILNLYLITFVCWWIF